MSRRTSEVIDDEDSSSSEGSDSGQSEDNLDMNELMKIMPRKIIKKRIGGNTK